MNRRIPTDSKPVTREGIDAIVYLYTTRVTAKPAAIAYGGKRSKADWNYSFRSDEQRQEKIEAYFTDRLAYSQYTATAKAAQRAFTHTLKIGDILSYSWGWEQTNVEFYQVVCVPSHKTVVVRAIASKMADMRVVAIPSCFLSDSPEILKRVGKGNYCSMDHGCLAPWDGKPMYCSW